MHNSLQVMGSERWSFEGESWQGALHWAYLAKMVANEHVGFGNVEQVLHSCAMTMGDSLMQRCPPIRVLLIDRNVMQ
jgi:hypothetical protein